MNRISRRSFLRARALPVGASLLAASGIVNKAMMRQAATPESFPPVTIAGTEARTLTSAIVGQEYEISVWLPPSYATTASQKYPTVYLLDGNMYFGIAANMGFPLTWFEEVREAIVVGIGVPMRSFEDWITHRFRDFTPAPAPDSPGSGGAAKFLDFLETELIPFIDANYRTSTPANRNIFGHSLGGLFGIYALLQKPGLFRGVIAASPSLQWANNAIFQTEAEVAENNTALPAKLYMSMGSLEGDMQDSMQQLADVLASRSYADLRVQTDILENATHGSGIAHAYVNGMKSIFSS
jgi:predicted alpha/beta superfamily hydrolase